MHRRRRQRRWWLCVWIWGHSRRWGRYSHKVGKPLQHFRLSPSRSDREVGVSTTSQAARQAGGTSSFGAICSATGGSSGPTSGNSTGGVGSSGDINLAGCGVNVSPENINSSGFSVQLGGHSYWGGTYGAGSASQTSGTTATGGGGIVLVEWVG